MEQYKPQTLQEQIEFTATGMRGYDLRRMNPSERTEHIALWSHLDALDQQGIDSTKAPVETGIQTRIKEMLTGNRGYEGNRVMVGDLVTEEEQKEAQYQADRVPELERENARLETEIAELQSRLFISVMREITAPPQYNFISSEDQYLSLISHGVYKDRDDLDHIALQHQPLYLMDLLGIDRDTQNVGLPIEVKEDQPSKPDKDLASFLAGMDVVCVDGELVWINSGNQGIPRKPIGFPEEKEFKTRIIPKVEENRKPAQYIYPKSEDERDFMRQVKSPPRIQQFCGSDYINDTDNFI